MRQENQRKGRINLKKTLIFTLDKLSANIYSMTAFVRCSPDPVCKLYVA